MTPRPARLERGRGAQRGQPVIALAMIIGMWIAVRVTFIALEGDRAAEKGQVTRIPRQPAGAHRAGPPAVPSLADGLGARPAMLAVPHAPGRSGEEGERRIAATGPTGVVRPVGIGRPGLASSTAGGAVPLLPKELAATYRPEGLAGSLSGVPNPSQRDAPISAGEGPADDRPHRPAPPRMSRWSADGWLLLRGGDQPPALAAGSAAYGGSQAGAVLRYRFASASTLRPQAYLRVSGALGSRVRQNEAALGVMVRPVKRLPIAVLGEWRLQEQSGRIRTRPVVMTITELPPLSLPAGIEAEAYAQGGWAGGRDATAFYDLAATLQRRVLRPLPGAQLSAGGGVWSGGQRGAVRLDVGPRVELRGMVGPPSRRIGVRVGADWRFRVAGRAEPGSGPALTVAAGF